jgi:hypothetical protein
LSGESGARCVVATVHNGSTCDEIKARRIPLQMRVRKSLPGVQLIEEEARIVAGEFSENPKMDNPGGDLAG